MIQIYLVYIHLVVYTKTMNDLEPPGTSWNHLEQAGTAWNKVELTLVTWAKQWTDTQKNKFIGRNSVCNAIAQQNATALAIVTKNTISAFRRLNHLEWDGTSNKLTLQIWHSQGNLYVQYH